MSDQDTSMPVEDAPEATATTETDEEPFDERRARAKIQKANAEAANLRKRLKELEPLAAKYRELEEANKSETQKLTERLTAAEKRAQDAELNALRLEVAISKGLPPVLAKRLIGATKEELEADADELIASFGGGERKPPSRRPVERLRGGGDPDEEPEEPIDQILARIPRR